MVVKDLRRRTGRIDRIKDRLCDPVKNRRASWILRSTEGIGKWGDEVLYIEMGDITRFDSVEKLVLCAGPDPQLERRGNQVSEKGISKKGNRDIRAVLYGCLTAAIRSRHTPPLRRHFDRLKALRASVFENFWRLYTAVGPTGSGLVLTRRSGESPAGGTGSGSSEHVGPGHQPRQKSQPRSPSEKPLEDRWPQSLEERKLLEWCSGSFDDHSTQR